MKSSFQHGQTSTFHRTQTNVQSQISSAKPHCELAVQYPIFETLQSCVCTTVTLSHRFKSSPSIPGNLAIPGTAGYMMNTGRFRNNYISTGDLNRGRRTESRVLFGYFLHDAKSDNSFSLQRTSRFCKPRFSALQYTFPLTKLNPFETFRGFSNLNSARRNGGFALTKLNPFAAFWRHCSCCCRNKSLPLRGFFRRLRRLSNFPFGKFVEVLQTSNQHTQTTVNLIKIRKIHINPLKISL